MKNLSLILNIVLVAAVAFLFFDKFSGPKKPVPVVQTEAPETVTEKPLKIVHVNLDSLHKKSNAYQAIVKQIEKRASDVRATLMAKQKAFEKEYEEAAKKAQSGTITPKQEQEYQASLQKKQESIANLQEKAGKELDDEQNKFNDKFIGDIEHFTDSLRIANGYDYVLYKGGIASPILSANSDLDITQMIVDLLNAKK